MEYLIGFLIGAIVGGLAVFIIGRQSKKETEKVFSAVSMEALRKNSEEFLKLANENLAKQTQSGSGELESKKLLIDNTLQTMKTDLEKIQKSISDFDTKREKGFAEIGRDLKLHGEQTGKLQETTNKLQMALASSRVRGQWGERMAEDVLRYAGFVENVNYLKQAVQESNQSRPDYTFLLPRDLKVNMDVKFPLENYLKYMAEDAEPNKENLKQQFLKDTRQRIKEVNNREYINPANNTVDYVLIFIPSEQVFCFINENDPTIIDDGIRQKAILCSPLTLYAMLAIIRQSVENFNMMNTEARVLNLFGSFAKQWEEFKKGMESMGTRLKQAQEEYERLLSTRRRALEKPLNQIEELRKERGLPGGEEG